MAIGISGLFSVSPMAILSKRATWTAVLALLGSAACLMVCVQPRYVMLWHDWAGCVAGGFLFGTFFAIVSLAGAWTSLGFGRLSARVWQSMGVSLIAVSAAVMNGVVGKAIWPGAGGSLYDARMAVALTVVALWQWLLIATPLALVRTLRSVSLQHESRFSSGMPPSDQQFGIRELFIGMVLTALLLSAIRGITQLKTLTPDSSMTEGLFDIGYLVICNVFVAMPLIVAPLLRRFALPATGASLAFIAVVTTAETFGYPKFMGPAHPVQVTVWQVSLASTNCVQSLLVLAVLGTLRAGGYRLAPQP